MKELFDFDKTVQATAYLLGKSEGTIPEVKLLKLLYIADRKYLFQHGFSITGDTMYTFKFGPVLKTVYNLLRGKDKIYPQWSKYIKMDSSDNKPVSVVESPGTGNLSIAEMKVLDSVFSEFGNMTESEIVDYTHTFEEWKLYYTEGAKAEMVDSENILLINHHNELISAYREHTMICKNYKKLLELCGN